jgi:hypothetical protein
MQCLECLPSHAAAAAAQVLKAAAERGELLLLAPCPGATDAAMVQHLKETAGELYAEWEAEGMLIPADMLDSLQQMGYGLQRQQRAGVPVYNTAAATSSSEEAGGEGSDTASSSGQEQQQQGLPMDPAWVSVPVDIALSGVDRQVAVMVSGRVCVWLQERVGSGYRSESGKEGATGCVKARLEGSGMYGHLPMHEIGLKPGPDKDGTICCCLHVLLLHTATTPVRSYFALSIVHASCFGVECALPLLTHAPPTHPVNTVDQLCTAAAAAATAVSFPPRQVLSSERYCLQPPNRLRGTSALDISVLQALGWVVLPLPVREWEGLDSQEAKREYLGARMRAALG